MICGLVICPFIMPLIMPDSTGRAAQLWLICGVTKCMIFIAAVTWAIFTKPPRETLVVMEWGCMGICVGIGIFAALSVYCVILDLDPKMVPENFVSGWLIQATINCVLGYLCVTGLPRQLGKSLLKTLKGNAEGYEHQSLAATIAIMIGADTGFRSIMESALGDFYAVSMGDVVWEEFEKNYPDVSKTDDFCIRNEEFCIKTRDSVFKMMNFAARMLQKSEESRFQRR